MDNYVCKIHNEPAQFCEQDAQQNLLLFCRFCIQQRLMIQKIDDVEDQQKQALQQLEFKFDQTIKQLKDFAEKLEQYTQQIYQKLNKLKSQVDQNIQHVIERKNYVMNMRIDLKNLQQNYIDEQENIINNQFTSIKQQLQNQLQDFEISLKLDKLYYTLDSLLKDVNNNAKNNNYAKQITMIDKKFDYQLIQQSSYIQDNLCFAIAFNKDGSIMIAGCKQMIKVFEFKDDKLREVQQLNGHTKDVYCLKFMKTVNQFISASSDSTIIIWECNQNYKWKINQILKGNTSSIYSMTINKNEDLLIFGSMDNKIKFLQINKIVFGALVNQSIVKVLQDQLIASVSNNQILIIKLQGKQWIIKQKIQVEQSGYRLCFINQDQFVFQPNDRGYLKIFDYHSNDKIFKPSQELQYLDKESDSNWLFPICYISQIGLIMVKNDQYVHLIKRNQNGLFTVEQSINFKTYCLYGGITDDGRYIATWDFESKEIQIRKSLF